MSDRTSDPDRIAPLRAFLDRKPADRFARYALALELAKVDRVDEALEELHTLLRDHPHSGAGHFQLGSLLRGAGRLGEAKSAWEAGLAALTGATDAEARRSVVEIRNALDALDDELDEDR